MKVCPVCGAELTDNVKFCTVCGADLENDGDRPSVDEIAGVPAPVNPVMPAPEKPIKPLGVFAYIGLIILFSIPCIGFISSLLMAILAKNKSVKNFATAALVCIVLFAVLSAFTAGILFAYVKSLSNDLKEYLDKNSGTSVSSEVSLPSDSQAIVDWFLTQAG